MPFASRVNDLHTCPQVDVKPHVGGPILPAGIATVFIGGQPAATIGNTCVCAGPPDKIIKGSATVFIQSKGAARVGDTTIHGGLITTGLPSVNIGG